MDSHDDSESLRESIGLLGYRSQSTRRRCEGIDLQFERPDLRRKVLVRVSRPVIRIRTAQGLRDLGQIAIHLQLGLLIGLSRRRLARVLVYGGRIRRFHLRSPF